LFPNTPKDKLSKMRFALASATLAALATTVFAAQIQVEVGVSGLAFSPSSVNASQGDTIQFVFNPKNHTVTQSTFAAPCAPMSGGIDSGYMPVAANVTTVPSMTITVNDTTPLWFYCKQTGYGYFFFFFRIFFWLTMSYYSHCGQGMVFAVNPTENKTFDAFQAAAKASASSPTSSTAGSGSTGTGSSTSATSSPSPTNGAVAVGVRAGGILAVVGFVAGVLL
jgi:plastocyanin